MMHDDHGILTCRHIRKRKRKLSRREADDNKMGAIQLERCAQSLDCSHRRSRPWWLRRLARCEQQAGPRAFHIAQQVSPLWPGRCCSRRPRLPASAGVIEVEEQASPREARDERRLAGPRGIEPLSPE